MLKSNDPFKTYTQNKILVEFLKWKFYILCQFVPKRFLGPWKFNIKKFSFYIRQSAIWLYLAVRF